LFLKILRCVYIYNYFSSSILHDCSCSQTIFGALQIAVGQLPHGTFGTFVRTPRGTTSQTHGPFHLHRGTGHG
jgi:hypothetical protein